jgi:hypothetical protein
VPRQDRPGAGGQQLEALVEELQERGRREAAHARGRQLDRQRQPIEPLAQRRHRRGVGVGQGEARRGVRRSVGEQAHSVVPAGGGRAGGCLPAGNGQRLDLVADLAGDAEDLPAGGQHPQRAADRQQVGEERSRLGDHVLAVVDQQQALQLEGCVAEAFPHGAGRLGADAECSRQCVGDQVGGGNGSEVGQAHVVGETFGAGCSHLQRETGLARARRAGQGEQPMALE